MGAKKCCGEEEDSYSGYICFLRKHREQYQRYIFLVVWSEIKFAAHLYVRYV